MSGYEVYKKELLRLGYNSSDNEVVFSDSRLLRAKELINQILSDLNIGQINELSSPINCSKAELEAVCYGVMMLLSLSEGESEKNKLFTDIYNAKRAAVLSRVSLIEDTLPKAESGGV